MSQSPRHENEPVYDVLGVGFGPSNLALGIAIEEFNRTAGSPSPLRAMFLEKQATFGWHRGMLIDDATMQVSFFKDLVTMRDPTSSFSFLCYLKARDRLVEFINHKTLFPLRVEFHDYFSWVAGRLAHLAAYGAEVIAVEPVHVDGEVAWYDVISREGDDPDELVVRRARNVVVAPGLQACLPPEAPASDRVWHNSELVPRVTALAGAPLRRLMVVGAGQSAAETTEYLHRNFPDAEICAVFSRYGYTPADDSPYANRIFDPEAVNTFYDAPDDVKSMLLGYHRSTNYSVVDLDLIEALYRQEYRERVQGHRRLRILNTSRLRQVTPRAAAVDVAVEHLPTGEVTALTVDHLVYATGYRPADVSALLGEAGRQARRDDAGRIRVARDYRMETEPGVRAGIYLQGSTEYAHGISATLLSNTAVRAGEILNSILDHGRGAVPARDYAMTGDAQ